MKEINEILNIKDDFKLSKLLKALALQTGSLVSYNELMTLSGLNYEDLMQNINILSKTFMCARALPFSTNKRKEISKTPKFFFIDTGLRNSIINNYQNISDRTDSGALNENFVASEIVKSGIDLKYWRTKSKAEIDFIIEKKGKIIPLEVKSKINSKINERALSSFMEDYSLTCGYVFSENYSNNRRSIKYRNIFLVGKFLEDE